MLKVIYVLIIKCACQDNGCITLIT